MTKASNALKAGLTFLTIAIAAQGALALSPEAEKRKNAGNEFQKRRQYEAAQNQYMEALRIEPDYADAHYNLGMLYFYRIKDYPKALYHLNTYRRLETGAPDMNQVVSHISQSIEHIEAGEREDYKIAVLENSQEGFERFLKKYPVGYYADNAREEIKKIIKFRDDKAKVESIEQNAFTQAVAAGTTDALDKFLSLYPTSSKADEARGLRQRLAEKILQEKIAYQKAEAEGQIPAYEEYLRAYPNGLYAEKVKSNIAHLKAAEEALAQARETGSSATMAQYLEVYSDTPYAQKARELLEEFKKVEVEKAAAAEAQKLLAQKQAAEAEAKKKADEEAKKASQSNGNGRTNGQAKPADQQKPVEQPKSAEQVKPSEQAKPADDLTSVGERENKRRAEAREKAKKLMEAEIRRLQEQKKLQEQNAKPQ